MKNAPLEHEGKCLIFQETFVSPFENLTESGALRTLDNIRAEHPESKGWLEIYGGVERLPNGKYRAVRKHAKYR